MQYRQKPPAQNSIFLRLKLLIPVLQTQKPPPPILTPPHLQYPQVPDYIQHNNNHITEKGSKSFTGMLLRLVHSTITLTITTATTSNTIATTTTFANTTTTTTTTTTITTTKLYKLQTLSAKRVGALPCTKLLVKIQRPKILNFSVLHA